MALVPSAAAVAAKFCTPDAKLVSGGAWRLGYLDKFIQVRLRVRVRLGLGPGFRVS